MKRFCCMTGLLLCFTLTGCVDVEPEGQPPPEAGRIQPGDDVGVRGTLPQGTGGDTVGVGTGTPTPGTIGAGTGTPGPDAVPPTLAPPVEPAPE